MSRIELPYVHEFRDRHGTIRRYFRRPGYKRVKLPGLPGSPEYLAAYQNALAQKSKREAAAITTGTADDAVLRYYNSTAFKTLARQTQRLRRRHLEDFRRRYREKPMALLAWEHIDAMIAAKSEMPGACRSFVTALRGLIKYCIKSQM